MRLSLVLPGPGRGERSLHCPGTKTTGLTGAAADAGAEGRPGVDTAEDGNLGGGC